MKTIFNISIFTILLWSCGPSNKVSQVNQPTRQVDSTQMELINNPIIDTITIGKNQTFKNLDDFFKSAGKKENLYILVESGNYYTNGLWVEGQNITLVGQENVNLFCEKLYENVMWISGENITVKNFHMKHFKPGYIANQNCSGRVIAFDNAHHVTIENCDLNGCGLAGLHDNLGNSDIFIKNNYIHNNSVAAYTDINGGMWQKEIDDHPVFKFENNKIENNGPDRQLEGDSIKDYIISADITIKDELIRFLEYEIEDWQSVENPVIAEYIGTEFGDYFHINFKTNAGKILDFGFGNNDFSGYILYRDLGEANINKEYLHKKFLIHWEWLASSFPCCNGGFDSVDAFYPSVVKLQLLEE